MRRNGDWNTVGNRPVMIRIWNLVGIIGIAGTLLSLFSRWFWMADLASQLSVQYLILLIVGLPLWIRGRRRKTVLLAIAGLVWNLWMVLPYFVPSNSVIADSEGVSAESFQLAIFNVLRTNPEVPLTVAEALGSDPDFLYLMETGPDWKQPLEELSQEYPHQKVLCRDDYTGVAFLSRFPWENLQVVDVPDSNPPLDVQFLIKGRRFRLILTHPLPPISPDLRIARDRQLLDLAASIEDETPTLLAGDFNLAPWSGHFTHLLRTSQLHDLSTGFGIQPTLTPLPTLLGGVKVDHVLGNSRVSLVSFAVSPSQYSDHSVVCIGFRPTYSGPGISQRAIQDL